MICIVHIYADTAASSEESCEIVHNHQVTLHSFGLCILQKLASYFSIEAQKTLTTLMIINFKSMRIKCVLESFFDMR